MCLVLCRDGDMQEIKILPSRLFNFVSERDMQKNVQNRGRKVLQDQDRQSMHTHAHTALDLRGIRKDHTKKVVFEFNLQAEEL